MACQGKKDDQDVSTSDLKHEPASNPAVKNKAEKGMVCLELRSNGGSLETIVEQLESDESHPISSRDPSSHLSQDADYVTASPSLSNLPDLPGPSGGCSVPDEAEIEVVEEPQATSPFLSNEGPIEQKCPACAESYDAKLCEDLLLVCNHMVCQKCVKTMIRDADLNTVVCPVCQHTTQLMELEMRKLREELLTEDATIDEGEYVCLRQVMRRPGLCGTWEYKYRRYLRPGRLPPSIRRSQRIMNRLEALQQSCPCLYYCVLAVLVYSEISFSILMLLILFISIVVILLKHHNLL